MVQAASVTVDTSQLMRFNTVHPHLRFSIVIPTYGRPARLKQCLQTITELDYSFDTFEVVVVDDGNLAETRDVVMQFVHRLRTRYIAQPSRSGPAAARNTGASQSSGAYLVFLDDDCTVLPGWLRGFDEVLTGDATGTAIGGRVINAVEDNIYAAASQNVMEFLYEWYNDRSRDARFFATNNLLCPRRDFLAIGGFDERFSRAAAEDRDFCDRWRESGRRLVPADHAMVSHYHRLTLSSFVAQHFGYGRGAVDLHLGRDRRGVDRPRLEPLTFYARLVTYPLRQGKGPRQALLMGLGAATQAAYATGYYMERLRRVFNARSGSARRQSVPTAEQVRPIAESDRPSARRVHVDGPTTGWSEHPSGPPAAQPAGHRDVNP